MQSKNLTPWLGLLGPVPVLVCAALAATRFGGHGAGYSPFRNVISALGNPSRSAWSAVFDAGMLASGLCLALFAAAAGRRIGTAPARAVAAMGVVSSIAMMGIGLVSDQADTRTAHDIIAAVGFVSLMMLGGALAAHLSLARQPVLPRWLAVPGLLTVCCAVPYLALLVPNRMGRLPESRLQFHVGSEGCVVCLLPTLEWAVFLSMLLLNAAIALSMLLSPEKE